METHKKVKEIIESLQNRVTIESPEFKTWFEKAKAKVKEEADRIFGDKDDLKDTIGFSDGKRYIRIHRMRRSDETQKSAWAFIDKTTGDILRPAGWSTPAKNARGNIFDGNQGHHRVSSMGPEYNTHLRGKRGER